MSVLLEINDLTVSFRLEEDLVQAVRDVNLAINQGETVAIVGESGAGKSQIFHALMGIQAKNAVVSGSAIFAGRDLLNQKANVLNQIRGMEISIIFQDPMTALNPYLKVGKQLVEVLQVHKNYDYKKAKERALTALEDVKIPEPETRFSQYPHELSGGMRQRVMIAMALLCEPSLIIADEPTTALDVTVQSEIISLLRSVNEKYKTAIVLITHDIPLVAGLCDRVIIMYAGKIVETGSIYDIHQSAQHPYTRALLQATPNYSGIESKLISIAGNPPSHRQILTGCAFQPRCQLAVEQCMSEQPGLVETTDTRSVACFRWNEQL